MTFYVSKPWEKFMTLHKILMLLPNVDINVVNKEIKEILDTKILKGKTRMLYNIALTEDDRNDVFLKQKNKTFSKSNPQEERYISPYGAAIIVEMYFDGLLKLKPNTEPQDIGNELNDYISLGFTFSEYHEIVKDNLQSKYASAKEEDFDYKFLKNAFFELRDDRKKISLGNGEGTDFYLTIAGIPVCQHYDEPTFSRTKKHHDFGYSFRWIGSDGQEHKIVHEPKYYHRKYEMKLSGKFDNE